MHYKFLLAIALMLTGCAPAMASPQWTQDNVIKALAGEAGGQSFEELKAVAHALHNRGDLGGVYGLYRKTTQKERGRALIAWGIALKESDPTLGATYWLSDYDLKHAKPKLIAFKFKMIETAYIGETHFYKERL